MSTAWESVKDISKFADRGHSYFSSTWRNAGAVALIEAVEPAPVATGNPRALDDWRREMTANRLATVGKPGVFCDFSPTGSGKSYADREAMKKAGRSLIVLPDHKNCREAAETFCDAGLDAAAWPDRTARNCREFKQIESAWQLGISATGVVCIGCSSRDTCSYWGEKERAVSASHLIVTHKRAALSLAKLAEGRPFISIHEDTANLFRPVTRVRNGFDDVARVAQQAEESARRTVCTDRSLVEFLNALNTLATALHDALNNAERSGSLEIPPTKERPGKLHAQLWETALCSRLKPPKAAMSACISLLLGHFEAAVEVISKEKKGEKRLEGSIVCVGRTEFPKNATIVYSDATGSRDALSALTGLEVTEITPQGHLPLGQRIIQYHDADITIGSTSQTVANVLQRIFVEHPELESVGLITHQVHIQQLIDNNTLPADVQQRIRHHTHYRSGTDRGSNVWIEDCQAILLVGTPRVPPVAVRDRLWQMSQQQAAIDGARWVTRRWEIDDDRIAENRGYREGPWRDAHQAIVRDLIVQALGRARPILETGVPAILCTSEPLGIAGLDIRELPPLRPELSERQREIMDLFKSCEGIRNGDIVQRLGVSKQIANRELNNLLTLNRLRRSSSDSRVYVLADD